jgi:hypothetical protein
MLTLACPPTPEVRCEKRKGALNRVYESANSKFAPNVWFVADSGVTTQEVSAKLDVKPGGIAGVVVVKIESYFGFAPTAIWEWFSVKTSGT